MSLAAELWPFLALGGAGFLHCAGMCGGFALAMTAGSSRGRRRLLARQASYLVGKAASYAVLGILVAAGCRWLVGAGEGGLWPAARAGAAWAAGLVMVALGLAQLGVVRWPRGRAKGLRSHRAAALVRRAADAMRTLPGSAGAFGTGVVNGLLPCGLSWAAIALASQGSLCASALGPFVFGLATAPALLAVGLAPRFAARLSGRGTRIAVALLLVAFGAATVLRGHLAQGADPTCCPAPPYAGP